MATQSLSAGSHTVDLRRREDGYLVDKIWISRSTNSPSGTGGAENLCPSTARLGVIPSSIGLAIQPTPTTGGFTVSHKGAMDSKVALSVIDVKGKTVYTVDFVGNKYFVSEKLQRGIYVVQALVGVKVYSTKLIVK